MRWFFFLLVIANVGVYYGLSSGGDRPAAASPLVKDNLVLLAEVSDPVAGVAASAPPPDEVADADADVDEAAVPVLEQRADAGEVSRECWVLGEFETAEAMPEVGAAGLLRRLRESREQAVDYWVHLGPYPDFDAALAVSSQLRERGLDSFVIARGELQNAVSLGVFSDPARADRHVLDFTRRGFSPKIHRLVKLIDRYWIVLQGDAGNPLFQQGLQEIKALAAGSVTAEKKSCNLIASLKEFD